MIPRSAISHSGRFSLTSITRSPGSSPMRVRLSANAATCRAASFHVTACHAPSRFAERNGLSPFSVARVRNMLTRLGKRSSWRAVTGSFADCCAFAARVRGADPVAADALDRIGLEARLARLDLRMAERLESGDHGFVGAAALDEHRVARREQHRQSDRLL